jgi:hypothetical protein
MSNEMEMYVDEMVDDIIDQVEQDTHFLTHDERTLYIHTLATKLHEHLLGVKYKTMMVN